MAEVGRILVGKSSELHFDKNAAIGDEKTVPRQWRGLAVWMSDRTDQTDGWIVHGTIRAGKIDAARA